jgi:ring-1,2-phenylacetyl-CoA epoxidase subunit PaaE
MGATHSHSDAADRIRTIPDPGEKVPLFAWPTLGLFTAAVAMIAGSWLLVLGGVMPWPIGTLVNSVAGYMLFTVTHDASHHAASSNTRLNTLLGEISVPLYGPPIGFKAFRYIHMQHHQHTNKTDGSDPDHYTMAGTNFVSSLLRWATLDLNYIRWYAPKFSKRPAAERREVVTLLALFAAVVALCVVTGNGVAFVELYLLPSRLVILFLGFAFDYLPHHGLDSTPKQNRFQATRNRIGFERVMKYALLYQNYHLVHHLHPVVPFYRYIRVWLRNEDEYLDRDPALSTVGGRPLTVDEYRQLRELEHHH